MKNESKRVTQYLHKAPVERQYALQALRALCTEELMGYEETMAYKMPSYKKDGQVEVAFASQKQHICVYILKHDVMLTNSNLLQGTNHGKGCIRFANPDKIDFKLIRKLLKETVKSDHKIC